jgi:hypothetical protein
VAETAKFAAIAATWYAGTLSLSQFLSNFFWLPCKKRDDFFNGEV